MSDGSPSPVRPTGGSEHVSPLSKRPSKEESRLTEAAPPLPTQKPPTGVTVTVVRSSGDGTDSWSRSQVSPKQLGRRHGSLDKERRSLPSETIPHLVPEARRSSSSAVQSKIAKYEIQPESSAQAQYPGESSYNVTMNVGAAGDYPVPADTSERRLSRPEGEL